MKYPWKFFNIRITKEFLEGFALGLFVILVCFFLGKYLIQGPASSRTANFIEGFVSGLGFVIVVFLVVRLNGRLFKSKNKANDTNEEE